MDLRERVRWILSQPCRRKEFEEHYDECIARLKTATRADMAFIMGEKAGLGTIGLNSQPAPTDEEDGQQFLRLSSKDDGPLQAENTTLFKEVKEWVKHSSKLKTNQRIFRAKRLATGKEWLDKYERRLDEREKRLYKENLEKIMNVRQELVAHVNNPMDIQMDDGDDEVGMVRRHLDKQLVEKLIKVSDWSLKKGRVEYS